jgi:sugar (pentulose or hexulose) kinase
MADVLGRAIDRAGDPVNAGVRGAGLLGWVALEELRVQDLRGRAAIAARHEPRGEHRATYERLFAAFRAQYKASRRARAPLAAVRESQETST